MEIERKFRLGVRPRLKERDGVDIEQGYLVTNGVELRIRSAGGEFFLTVKDEGGGSRHEWEKRIPAWAFALLWPHTEGRRITKRRYTERAKGHTVEIDVYSGRLEGLVILECEFDSKGDARRFRLPKRYGDAREVTDDAGYRNRKLATARKPPRS